LPVARGLRTSPRAYDLCAWLRFRVVSVVYAQALTIGIPVNFTFALLIVYLQLQALTIGIPIKELLMIGATASLQPPSVAAAARGTSESSLAELSWIVMIGS
jgi:hypothetical protein